MQQFYSRQEKNGGSIQVIAHPHPNQLTCKVKGPNGNQVASVPIYLPLSIMASYAVTSNGGSDELAEIASDAVIAQGISCARQMNVHVLDYINSLANHAYNTIMSKTGDRVIADEVKTMILGGGKLILKSNNNAITNQCQESRDDDANDAMTGEDVQSIATSVLNNFEPYRVRSAYAINDRVATTKKVAITQEPSFLSPTYSIESVAANHAARKDEITTSSWFWACNTTKDTQIQSSSLDKVLNGHQAKQPTSIDPTWDTSNNTNEYEVTSTFNIDTFSPVPTTFYKVPHDRLGCPNLSMEPVKHIRIEKMSIQNENDVVEKAASSEYIMNSTGRGIVEMYNQNDINIVTELHEITNKTDQPTNDNQSINTDNIQSQITIGDCFTFNAQFSCPGAVIPPKYCDQTSSTEKLQSSDNFGLHVGDITGLNIPPKELPLFKRIRQKFGKWN